MRKPNNIVANLLRRIQALELKEYERAKAACEPCQASKTISNKPCPLHDKPITHQDAVDLNKKIEEHQRDKGMHYMHVMSFGKQRTNPALEQILKDATVESFEIDTRGEKVTFKGIAKRVFSKAQDPHVQRLAQFIMDNVPGEPSQSQGAVDTAIRIIQEQQKEIVELKRYTNKEHQKVVALLVQRDVNEQFIKRRDGQLDWCKIAAENNPDVKRLARDNQGWSPAYEAVCKLRDAYERLVLKGMTKPKVNTMQAQPQQEAELEEKPLTELEDAYYQQAEVIQTLREQLLRVSKTSDDYCRSWRQAQDALARLERTTHQAERNASSAWKRCRIAEEKLKRLRRHHSR